MEKYLENEQTFFKLVEETLELTDDILLNNINTPLDEIEEWDSLAIMSFVSLLDIEFKIEIEAEKLEDCKCPKDLYNLVLNLKN